MDKPLLLPGFALVHVEGRWQPARVDRAANITASMTETPIINGVLHAVFVDGRDRRWAKPYEQVEVEQRQTWTLQDLADDIGPHVIRRDAIGGVYVR